MATKFNPAGKLNLPEPPKDCFWNVYSDSMLGSRIELRQRRRKFKINYTWRIDERGYVEWNWKTKEVYSIQRGLELAAQNIINDVDRQTNYFKQTEDLYDDKEYLDDLIDTTKPLDRRG